MLFVGLNFYLLLFNSFLAANFHFKDSTFEFERKHNSPARYDRNVTENTFKAINKIDKIRVHREERHCKEDERKESQGAQRSNKGPRAEHSHGQSSFCARQRAITYTAYQVQGYTKAVGGKSHGGMNILLTIFYIFKLKTLNLMSLH